MLMSILRLKPMVVALPILVTLMLLMGLFSIAPVVHAQAASQKSALSADAPAHVSLADCQHLLVKLHGLAPATGSCLDKHVSAMLSMAATSGTTPDLGFVDCGNHANSLILWFDTNFQGGTICFENAGSTDMTQWNCPAPHVFCNWNDNASSYQSRCSAGTFYIDVGEQGPSQKFAAHEQHNFDGLSGRLPNDSLSSLTLNTNC